MAEKNYYLILGVKNTACFDEIKAAYRTLAKKYHPDKNHGNKAAEEYFKEIQQAYAVLSNVEKRKKYDLKFSYSHTYSKQNAAPAGKSYQQEKQQTKQKTSPKQTKTKPSKFDYTETWQILVSVGIALLLLYFIISYNTEKSASNSYSLSKEDSVRVAELLIQASKPKAPEEQEPESINSDSPYSKIFGEEVYAIESKNNIVLHNSEQSEVVVCLVQSESPNKTIRNQYLEWGATFKFNNIPDGNYFLKVYFGTKWDEKKSFLFQNFTGKIKGGFSNEMGFVKLNAGKNVLKFKQDKIGTTQSYSAYDIILNPLLVNQNEKIAAEEFFQ